MAKQQEPPEQKPGKALSDEELYSEEAELRRADRLADFLSGKLKEPQRPAKREKREE